MAEIAFPGVNRGSSAVKLAAIDDSPPAATEYLPADAGQLHDAYQAMCNKVYTLVGWLDRDREYVRRAGAEVTVLECQMLLDSPTLKHAKSALIEAAVGGTGVRLANASMDRIHRLERLVSEAEARLFAARFVPVHHNAVGLGDGVLTFTPPPAPPAPPVSKTDTTIVTVAIVGGVILLALLLVALINRK